MNITIVIPQFFPNRGGVEIQAMRQATELARRGHVVTVLTWRMRLRRPDQDLAPREEVNGFSIIRVDRSGRGAITSLPAYAAFVRKLAGLARASNVVFCHHMLSTAYLAGWVGMFARIPVAVKMASVADRPGGEHEYLSGGLWNRCLAWFAAWPLVRFGVGVAMTDQIERDLVSLGFRRVVRIPNGVQDPGVPNRQELRKHLLRLAELDEDAEVVVGAGRLDQTKGFGVLLSAWPEVCEARPRARLVLIGSGPGEMTFRNRVLTSGLERSVRFIPWTEPLVDLLGGADVVAVPSTFEGMSNVLLEAMAIGTPVVSTMVSGSVDLIRDGWSGRLVPAGDAAAMAAALVATIECPADMGRHGRDTVLARCELSHVVDQYETLAGTIRALPPGVTHMESLLSRTLAVPHHKIG